MTLGVYSLCEIANSSEVSSTSRTTTGTGGRTFYFGRNLGNVPCPPSGWPTCKFRPACPPVPPLAELNEMVQYFHFFSERERTVRYQTRLKKGLQMWVVRDRDRGTGPTTAKRCSVPSARACTCTFCCRAGLQPDSRCPFSIYHFQPFQCSPAYPPPTNRQHRRRNMPLYPS